MNGTESDKRGIARCVSSASLNVVLATLVVISARLMLRLDRMLPAQLPASLHWPGLLLAFVGLSLVAGAEFTLVTASGATGAPGDQTRQLVIRGLYRFTRNPIYLGGALLLAGVGMWMRS